MTEKEAYNEEYERVKNYSVEDLIKRMRELHEMINNLNAQARAAYDSVLVKTSEKH